MILSLITSGMKAAALNYVFYIQNPTDWGNVVIR